ncbi:unnamed protein product, partial [Closterium sp. Naga37s-1]
MRCVFPTARRSRARWFRSGRAMVMPDNGDGLRTAMERSERSKRYPLALVASLSPHPLPPPSLCCGMVPICLSNCTYFHEHSAPPVYSFPLVPLPFQQSAALQRLSPLSLSCSSYNLPFSHLSHQRPVPPLIIPLTPGLGSGVALVYSSAASSYTAPRLLSCSSATPPFSTTAFQQAMPLGCLMCIGAASVFVTLCLPASIAVLFVLSLPLPSIPFTHTQLMCLGRSCPTGADSVLVGMWHDLPETPRQEEQLRRAKVAAEAASDAKSIVLRNMRHEICTPMHAPNSPRWTAEARQGTCIFSEQSKIDSQRPSALPRASRTFGSALSLKRSMYLQPETYRHAQEDKAPGTCIKEGPSGRAIRGCWVAGLLGCWEANSTGMLRQIIPHRVSNVIEFTHTVVTHQLLHCTPHVLLLLLHYSSILQTGPPARQGFQ